MNLLLLREDDVEKNNVVTLNDYRAEHIRSVLKLCIGDLLSLGRINGQVGKGEIVAINSDSIRISNIQLTQPSPPQLNVDVILALPRPRMLQRSLQTMATMGVKRIHLIHSERVEKSFWQTPLLKTAAIRDQLLLGLEQAKATQMPEVLEYKCWRDVKDCLLPSLKGVSQKIIAHPGNYPQAAHLHPKPTALAIGPEGGFTEKEVNYFIENNFSPVQLGQRILRVETAVPVLLAKLFY